ncbi:fimbrial assembly protein [Rhodanobacter thiooxydans]|uniref:Fimbrial assembly protein n=1 Tax=Rhodanobacter thiooxydans TaxID=416169 RepID=A0A154QDJ7_9GAMM|nr:PilN domain-containing protein [Rhodanobacter thiooxydans]EIL98650.1 Fimbrial assembly protein (PilN) [Rhodanobacter thiooxydans LCS2]KZC22318.1 fimbrial assembly protein [Rhodanobacter thiooxydans]MCW0200999.1 PilN domain-containing protein [Rhodanobacter thiooxydans]
MITATPSLRPWVERVRRGWRASPLPGFLGWWGGELRELLPPRWRGWFGSGADWHLLQHADAQWTLRRSGHADVLARWEDGAMMAADGVHVAPAVLDDALGRVDREDLRLALLLPPALALRRTLTLPLAARDNLLQVAGFEVDRQTPFQLAQVYYAVREPVAPAPPGRFGAELVVATRDTLDPLLARLRAQGIEVDAVDLMLGDGRLGANLLPPQQVPRRARPRRRLNLMLAAACVLLALLMLGEWLHNRQLALTQMQTEVAAMRGEAQQVAALRQQLQDNAGAAGFLARRKHDTVAMLGLLQEVTERLPDSTWLERFSVDNTGQVGFQGQSQQAAKLLDVLKDSKLITDASFQGSIQPDPTTGKERFYLTARVNQPKPPPANPAPGGSAP